MVNPLHLGGFGVEILTTNPKPHAELKITVGRKSSSSPVRYLFLPRRIEYDSIVLENATGNISFAALRWLSAHNIPIYFLDFDGSTISSILPPIPVKADLRVAQIEASNNNTQKATIARALVEGKIRHSLFVLEWLRTRYDIEKELQLAKGEAEKLSAASTVFQIRTVEGRVALRYWEAIAKAMPEELGFEGRMTSSHNNNASDCCNAALNYGYGFIKILCRTAINSIGLEPAVGFLHETSSAQTAESLVYDLMEPFRFLADICVIQAFESGKLGPSDFAFTRNDYLYRIGWDGKMRLLDHLREAFNSGVNYKGRVLKWDTVIEQMALEFSRYLTGKTPTIGFSEPSPEFERQDSRDIRENILSLTNSEAKGLGIGKSELHYLRTKASTGQSFRLYQKVMDKISRIGKNHSGPM